jgi:predicted nucleic acid-binding protein
MERATRGLVILELSPLVLAETAFTLESYYGKPRREVAVVLIEFIRRSGVRLSERETMLNALERVRRTGVHLVDAYLAARAAETGMPVASFDRDLDQFSDIKRHEPKP